MPGAYNSDLPRQTTPPKAFGNALRLKILKNLQLKQFKDILIM
jgi:hypothetical protein